MKTVSGMTVYEGADKCSLDEYSAKMATEVPKLIKENKYNDEVIKKEITEIKNKNEFQDKDIENLQQKNIQLQEELENEKSKFENYAIHGKSTGEYIHLTDSSETDCRVDVRGNAKQVVTEQSTNTLDLTKLSITEKPNVEIDGISANEVTFHTTNNTASSYYLRFKTILKKGTCYVRKLYNLIDGTAVTGNNGSGVIFISKSDWSKEFIRLYNNVEKGSFSLQEDTEVYITLMLGKVENGKIRFYNLMLANSDVEYTPFIPNSPSLNYPSKIETVKGSVKVTSSSVNTLDLTKLQTINVTECTVNEKSKNQITLTTTQNEGASYIRFKIHLKKGIWYFKRKFELIEGKGAAITGTVTAQTLDWKWIFQLEKNIEKVQFELKEDTDFYLAFNIKGSLDTNTEELKIKYYDIMLSNYDVDYAEHKEDSVVLPIQEEMCALKVHENNQNYNYIAKDGTKYICDEIIKKNNKYYYRKWIDSLDTTSAKSAMVRTATNNVSINYFVEDLLHSVWNVMTSFARCNKFKQCTPSLIDKENSFAIWNGNKNIAITIDNSCLEDVSTNEKALESWNKLIKKWEAEGTALKLIYCRENPKDIEITSSDTIQALEKLDKLKTYKNITNITTDSIAILDVDYKKDLETLLNQVNQALVEGS